MFVLEIIFCGNYKKLVIFSGKNNLVKKSVFSDGCEFFFSLEKIGLFGKV